MIIFKVVVSLFISIYLGGYLGTILTLVFQRTIGALIAATSFNWLSTIWAGVFFGLIETWFTRFIFLWIVKEYNWKYLIIVALSLLIMQLRPTKNTTSEVRKNEYIIAIGTIMGFIVGYTLFK